jgi:CubicO group peptidase (beta-lactamase class C family)
MKFFRKNAMADPYAILDEAEVFRAIEATKLKSLPGVGRPRYSNYGFGLLGFALEKVTNKAYEDLLMQEIINPIGLSTATFGDEGLRQGHSGKKQVGPWHMGRFAAMGRLRMSALDLSKFLRTSQDTTHPLAQAFAETFKIRFSSKRAEMGLAWHFFNDKKIVGHGGGTLGARTEGYIDLETGTVVPEPEEATTPINEARRDRMFRSIMQMIKQQHIDSYLAEKGIDTADIYEDLRYAETEQDLNKISETLLKALC